MGKKKPQVGGLAPKGAKYYEFEEGYRIGRDGSLWTQRQRGIDWSPTLPWRRVVVSPTAKRPTVKTASGRVWGIASLVLEAFIGPRPQGQVPRHRDEDIHNNSVKNLEWGKQPRARALTTQVVKEIWRLHRKEKLEAEAIVARLGLQGTGPVRLVLEGRSWNDITGLPKPPSAWKASVLTDDLVKEAMRLFKEENLTPTEIAVRLGLGQRRSGLIKNVLTGIIWNHVTGLPRRGG